MQITCKLLAKRLTMHRKIEEEEIRQL